MPLVRITLNQGKSASYLAAVSDSIYQAMLDKCELPENDKFHIFEQVAAGSLVFSPDHASKEPRSDDFMIIQIVADARRKSEKSATFRAICDRLVTSPGVKPQDVMVLFSTTRTLEDFSLGYGVSAASVSR